MDYNTTTFARLAQLVERLLDVERVSGSSPLSRTTKQPCNRRLLFLCQNGVLCLLKATDWHKKEKCRAHKVAWWCGGPLAKNGRIFRQRRQNLVRPSLLGPPCTARDNGLSPLPLHEGCAVAMLRAIDQRSSPLSRTISK